MLDKQKKCIQCNVGMGRCWLLFYIYFNLFAYSLEAIKYFSEFDLTPLIMVDNGHNSEFNRTQELQVWGLSPNPWTRYNLKGIYQVRVFVCIGCLSQTLQGGRISVVHFPTARCCLVAFLTWERKPQETNSILKKRTDSARN